MAELSQRERITQYAQDTFGTEAEYLWGDIPDGAVFRHPASRKWYALIMGVSRSRLGLPGEKITDVLTVKCGPILSGSLLTEPGFLPAYHMNKTNWISVLLDETVPDEKIFPLLDLSYDSVAPKRRKKSSLTTEGGSV
ncbi:MmcQ/YjbR family DNA-binding protein [Pseudoflavonifractor sp. 60]|uniref:MmcQ/YjbR family DNA-binding protein n=1 Tax=Pseudoflavonifractor sp. 60 TaxID=2304576 RepID=UPI001370EAD9|nr:MmcQ/YjbR family DNA-binding protein [Pseudoflavonifractor sp. 60]NBI66981.1 MmcQ/YjbR family DNA-binding protein [Pseudoflavonifractor sp. 60]